MNKFLSVALVASALSISAFAADSGLKVGETVSAFHPKHVAGPHKGTDACPPCTYGNLPMVQVWVNGDDMNNVLEISKSLEKAVDAKKRAQFKAFVIVLTDPAKAKETAKTLEAAASKSGFKSLAVAYLSKDDHAIKDYKVNTDSEVKNTVFVYKDRTVQTKFVNLKGDQKGLSALNTAIDKIAK
ncbi:MAG: hypothetical protein ACO1SV_22905 [Fimbriimonas sp.]